MNHAKKYIYITTGVVLTGIIGFTGFMALKLNGDEIVKNTYVNNVYIGDMTKDEAKKELGKKYDLKDVRLSYANKNWSLNSKDVGLSYNLEKTVEDAYSVNRDGSYMENLGETIKSNFGEKNNVKLKLDCDKNKLKSAIENISKDVNVKMENATININNSNVEIVPGHNGQEVDIDKTIDKIVTQLEKGNNKDELVVKTNKQDVTESEVKNVDTLLASYTTTFNSSVGGRNSNIRLAAKRTSDVLVMPGETFSYNEHTKMRTVANGYKSATVIIGGAVANGIGGGVCQVSSTLYNSVLYSGLEIVDLKNHSIPSTYVPKGRDATVTDGGIDFVFKNNLKHPIYLKNYSSSSSVTCQIYGSKEDKQNIEILTNVDGVSQAYTKTVNDPSLPRGTQKQLERGRNAYTVSTYRVFKDDSGNATKKEKIYTSYYPKRQGVIAVGTMDARKPVVKHQAKRQVQPKPQPSKPQPTPQPPVVNPTPPPQPPVVTPPAEGAPSQG